MCMFTFSDMPEKVSQDGLHVIEHWNANTKKVDGHYEIPVPWIDSTFISHETRYMANVRHDALCVGETGASWRTGQYDESALVLKMITTLHLSVCHTFQHGCAQLISA